MIEKREFNSLGRFKNDWLNARYHFSFGQYHDLKRTQWGTIRVWNDDEIEPGTGFDPHSHADMEIITYVREGAITHQDSLGNVGRTEAGDVQVMSAGNGITHAEYNKETTKTQLYQIWILPEAQGAPPSWGAAKFPKGDRSGQFVTLASGFSEDSQALPIRQKARVMGASLRAGETVSYALDAGRHAYLAAAKGVVTLNGIDLYERDGAAIKDEPILTIQAVVDAELVLVDAP
ncbi:pirin family protein [Candidatus Phycosocius spiralis]|uniref:Pirin-like protein n=1 Tax=Candidatus Phycosocius spiralis TaxID=2815099 RepID=A0ABQ4PUY6_9PROT|nr:pirin family protein [Candidatus Phycosocius spiralis]GIU66832.1 pirin-like protein [Candidatus Phycosocius spiralis]